MHSGGSLMIFIAAIIGANIAPDSGQATLPVALMIAGVASSAIPLGKLQLRFGRKLIFIAFSLLAIVACALACLAISLQHFYLFCSAAFLMGFAIASAHQYRFAVIEHVGIHHAALVTSLLLLGGLLSAFIGPEIAVLGQNLIATEFMGSFLLLGFVFFFSFILLLFIDNTHVVPSLPHSQLPQQSGLQIIFRSPVLLLSLVTAAVGYGVMSFIMTATPLTMHEHAGHNLADTKFVIQSHIAAMFLPSLFSGYLVSRLGYRYIIWLGLIALLSSVVIALINTQFLHFWLALVLLGIGWNFLFVTATVMLPQGHNDEDRFKVQSTNDFIVFSFQALAALSSGWFLYHWQWQGILLIALPVLVMFMIFLFFSKGFILLKK
ncbi:MAG: MFS family permease [Pseudohongiellaceae bacterium]|jgi:MFS family permease